MLSNIELPAERRLLFIWLFFVLGLWTIYYVYPAPSLLQRFERAYYSTYWNRPMGAASATEWPEPAPRVGFIAPTYISTLVDTELWVSVYNADSSRTITPTVVLTDKVQVVLSGDATSGSTEPATVDAQILLREGETRADISSNSRQAIEFGNVHPLERVTRMVWVRILPLAWNPADNTSVFISDETLDRGEISFSFYLLSPDGTIPDLPLYSSEEANTLIDTRQSVTRGFIRTLLLPPWANGLLVGMSLVLAFMVNSMVSLVEQRITERMDRELTEQEKSRRLPWRFLRSQWWAWLTQIAFWALVIFSVLSLILFLSDRLILCFLSPETCELRWRFLYRGLGLLALAAGLFIFAYLAQDTTDGSAAVRIGSAISRVASGTQTRVMSRLASSLADSTAAADTTADAAEQDTPPSDAPPPAAIADEDAESAAAPPADENTAGLVEQINTLHDQIAQFAPQNGALDDHEIEPFFDEFHEQYLALRQQADTAPPGEHLNGGLDRLRQAGEALDEWRRFNQVNDLAHDLLIEIEAGKQEGTGKARRLLEVKLPKLQKTLKTEPATRLTAGLIEMLAQARETYQTRFVELPKDYVDEADLVSRLSILQGIADKDPAGLVAFFTMPNIDDSATTHLSAEKALKIGRARLTAHRLARLEAIEAEKQEVIRQKENGALGVGEAINRLEELHTQSNNLPGLPQFPLMTGRAGPEGEQLLGKRFETLQGDIGSLIDNWKRPPADEAPIDEAPIGDAADEIIPTRPPDTADGTADGSESE